MHPSLKMTPPASLPISWGVTGMPVRCKQNCAQGFWAHAFGKTGLPPFSLLGAPDNMAEPRPIPWLLLLGKKWTANVLRPLMSSLLLVWPPLLCSSVWGLPSLSTKRAPYPLNLSLSHVGQDSFSYQEKTSDFRTSLNYMVKPYIKKPKLNK